jgi:hypothetical protein
MVAYLVVRGLLAVSGVLVVSGGISRDRARSIPRLSFLRRPPFFSKRRCTRSFLPRVLLCEEQLLGAIDWMSDVRGTITYVVSDIVTTNTIVAIQFEMTGTL